MCSIRDIVYHFFIRRFIESTPQIPTLHPFASQFINRFNIPFLVGQGLSPTVYDEGCTAVDGICNGGLNDRQTTQLVETDPPKPFGFKNLVVKCADGLIIHAA